MWKKTKYTADAEGLAAFINEHLSPLCYAQEKEARHHEAIKNQALGEGLQAYRLEKLSRYETHLDRKFERSLGMLIKLNSGGVGWFEKGSRGMAGNLLRKNAAETSQTTRSALTLCSLAVRNE